MTADFAEVSLASRETSLSRLTSAEMVLSNLSRLAYFWRMDVQQLAYSLRNEVSLLFKRLRRQVRAAGQLSLTETTTLSLLHQQPLLLPTELATLANIAPQSMSQVLQHLAALGYLTRQPSATDKRKQHIRLTAAGEELVARARTERDLWLAAAISACLSPEEQHTLAAAVPLLQRLQAYTPLLLS
ncbi:hypothetical protein A0257_21330 [Hymenobacter psoromatis]|nr:hypothetical protein A0257_21330 [Hymenobacter psoromatis]